MRNWKNLTLSFVFFVESISVEGKFFLFDFHQLLKHYYCRCCSVYHHGMTCQFYQIYRADDNHSLRVSAMPLKHIINKLSNILGVAGRGSTESKALPSMQVTNWEKWRMFAHSLHQVWKLKRLLLFYMLFDLLDVGPTCAGFVWWSTPQGQVFTTTCARPRDSWHN